MEMYKIFWIWNTLNLKWTILIDALLILAAVLQPKNYHIASHVTKLDNSFSNSLGLHLYCFTIWFSKLEKGKIKNNIKWVVFNLILQIYFCCSMEDYLVSMYERKH